MNKEHTKEQVALTTKDCIKGAAYIQQLVKNNDYSIKTGIKTIDDYAGFFKGELILIGGAPASGKSTLCQQIALNMAKQGSPVLIASYEVNHEDIGINWICNMSKIDTYIWRMKPLTQEDKNLAVKASAELSKLPIYILDRQPTVFDIENTVEKLEEKGEKPEIIIVDYLNIMPSLSTNEKDSIEENLSKLICIAKQKRIPVIAISALNREAVKREVKLSKMSDLRGSGALEYGADKAIFISSDVGDCGKKNHSTMFVDIVKSRNTPPIVGHIKLKYHPQYHIVEDFT